MIYRKILKHQENIKQIYNLINQGKFDAARNSLTSQLLQSSAIKRIMLEVLLVEEPDRETIEMVITHGVECEISFLARRLNTLAVLGSTAPLLGLLGTVCSV